MTHVAITEMLDGRNVDWLEPVTDAQYAPSEGASVSTWNSAQPRVTSRRGICIGGARAPLGHQKVSPVRRRRSDDDQHGVREA